MTDGADRPRILIIDDDESSRRSLELILKKRGFGTELAATGKEALKQARSASYHVSFIDIKLPDMDGIELIEALKKIHPDIELCMITSFASLETSISALNKGASAYILKPLNMEEVLVTLDRMLEKQRLVVENRMLLEEVQKELTDRKQAEEALRESERRLRRIVTDAPMPIMIHAEDGEVLDISKAWTTLSGYSSSDIPTIADWTEKAYGQRMEGIRAIINDILKNDFAASNGEYTITTKSGKERIWDFISVPLGKLPDGRRLVLSMATDITERKQAESEIIKLSNAVSQSPASVIITDIKGNIDYVNPKFEEVTGYSLEDIKGKNPRFLKSGEMTQESYRELWETITGGNEWRGEFHNVKKNGELYWESASISPITDPEGRITHFLAVKEDITKRKQAEEALLSELELNEALAELARRIIDPETSIVDIARLTLEYAKTLTGSKHGFVVTIDEDSSDALKQTFSRVMGEGEPAQIRLRAKSDGTYAGLWAEAMKRKRSFYSNEPKSHEASKGYPDGHLSIENFLAVPTVLGGDLVGEVALANPTRDYNDDDLKIVERLVALYTIAIQSKQSTEILRRLNDVLEERVIVRTAEISKINKQLQEDIERRIRAEREVIEISEREQRRIGQDLHDNLGQKLTGITLRGQALFQNLSQGSGKYSADAKEISKLASEAIGLTRALSRELYPVDLEKSDLESVLKTFASSVNDLYEIPCIFTSTIETPLKEIKAATHLYRIAQEAVNNAVKHGSAEEIHMELLISKREILLSVSDDGVGFPDDLESEAGFGIHSMKYRAEIIGAEIKFGSNNGIGASISVRLKT